MGYEELAALAARTSPASVSDVMALTGHGHRREMRGLARLTPHGRMFGEAVTLRCLPMRADLATDLMAEAGGDAARLPFDRAAEATGRGRVLVIETGGIEGACVAGEIRLGRLVDTGAAGLVTDGLVRDSAAASELGYPVWTGGVQASAGTGYTHLPAETGGPVNCAGVLVRPGDWLIGGVDGVVVIPGARAGEVLRKAVAKETLDAYAAAKVRRDGVPSGAVYPPRPELIDEVVANTGVRREDLPF